MNRRQFQDGDEMGFELNEASTGKHSNSAMAAVSNKLLKVMFIFI